MEFDDDDEDQTFSEISCGPNCAVPKLLVGIVRVDHELGKTLYVLKVSIINTQLEWFIKRRYSEFLELRDEVYFTFLRRNVSQCFGCRWFSNSLRDFDFPRKHFVTSKEKAVIRFRRNRLDRFARLLASHAFSAIPKCVRCRDEPFNTIKTFFTDKATLLGHATIHQIQRALVPERFGPIADPSKSKIEFRRGRGIFRVIQVEKPILSHWREIEEAARMERLRRRRASFSSEPYSLCSLDSNDQVDLEEEKASNEDKDVAEDRDLDNEVVTTENAVPLQPLSPPGRSKQEVSFTHAETNPSRWERRELASSTQTAAKEA